MSRLGIPADPASRAALLSFGANAVLMVLKLVAGVISGSVAVLSDGVDSGQDVFAAGIAFFSVRYALTPPDAEHPYGHGRAETLSAMSQAVLISGSAVFITVRAVQRLSDLPESIGVDLGLATMALTALVNLAVVQYVARVARQTQSPAILSDAKHLWTNVVQAVGIGAGLALVAVTGIVALDPLIALGLAAYLVWVAARILRDATDDVLDASMDDEDLRFIEETLTAHCGEIGSFHGLRTRRSGQQPYIDVHVVQPAEMSVGESSLVARRVEESILARWPGAIVTIQTEPDHKETGSRKQEAVGRGSPEPGGTEAARRRL